MNADDYNQKQIDSENFTGEHLTKLTEFWQSEHFMKVDGKCGPNTLKNILEGEMVDGVDDADTNPTRQIWESFDGPLSHLPRSRKDVYALFGDPSNGTKVNKKWKKENIRTFRKAMALPGVDSHRYVKLHKLAEPYIREALRRAAEVSDYKINTFGDFVYRLMRSNNRLSYHSWGIAFDINAKDNRAIHYDTPQDKPMPWSDEWWVVYPNGMPREFVEAIQSVGFGWGGSWRTFSDPQHFQLVLP